MSRITSRLTILRAERHLSQRRLAALAGVRPDTVSALERGKSAGIQFDTLARICEALACEPGDLFEFEPDSHRVPVLGGPDEDEIVRQRLHEPRRIVDGPSFLMELIKESEKRQAKAGRHK